MHQEGILGVLGGMGPQATNTFYQRIIDRTQAESDQEHLRVLIWSDAKIPDRTAGILGTPDQAEAVYQHLLADAKLLERAGCTVLAIPCNTSHYFADRLQGELHIPLIHMIRETVSAIRAMGKTTVGILATDGTVRTGIYQQALEAAGRDPGAAPIVSVDHTAEGAAALESGKLYMTVDQNPEDQARAAVAAAVNLARGRAYDDGLRELLGNDCTDPEQPFVLRVPVEAVTA